jgi:hypothetical protein
MSIHHEVLEFLKDGGIAGATVHHYIGGYDVHDRTHTASVLHFGTDLPVIIQAVDREERIRDIIPKLKNILPGKLMIIEEVEIVSGKELTEGT